MADARARTVLVHGLWTHGLIMEPQRWWLARAGFDAVTYSYPSVRLTLSENAARLARFAATLDAPLIHWVGHSLGGVLILHMLAREAVLPPGRIVLLGSPLADTYSGRTLARHSLGERMLGRSVSEWINAAKPAQYAGREIGVIAGTRGVGLGRIVAPGLPRPNDGAVAVSETQLAAACDRLEMPVSHTGMLFSRKVSRQVCAFLRAGRFEH